MVANGIFRKAVGYQHNGLDPRRRRTPLPRSLQARPPLLDSERKAARILRINRTRLFELRQADRLPFVEHNGRHYYRRAHIDVLCRALTSSSASATLASAFTEAEATTGQTGQHGNGQQDRSHWCSSIRRVPRSPILARQAAAHSRMASL